MTYKERITMRIYGVFYYMNLLSVYHLLVTDSFFARMSKRSRILFCCYCTIKFVAKQMT